MSIKTAHRVEDEKPTGVDIGVRFSGKVNYRWGPVFKAVVIIPKTSPN